MKVRNMLGATSKTAPSDCSIASQILMTRGGYMKYMCNGIYSLYMPTRRITRKIEQIIREEMDAVDGQEVLFPVAMPATLWEESGRFTAIGNELVRWKDRSGNPMVLGMTHEEAAVHLARNTAQSYVNYPFMIYQIQTKFRDEPRARGGLIRVREFTMKDAYSFHTSTEDLQAYYDRVYAAYERIFRRCGVRRFVGVQSDSGMMGGSVSHEFMLLTPIGEDTLAICPACGYKANMEAAACVVHNDPAEPVPLQKVHTPGTKTIEKLASFLHVEEKALIKAVVYQQNLDDRYVIVFLRGDLEVNETKLRNYLHAEIHAAEVGPQSGIVAGFIGPYNLQAACTVVYDRSLQGIDNLTCGANEEDYHYTGLCIRRDIGEVEYVDVAKTYAGALCPQCGKPVLSIENGIEIGNIFQLGTKYTKSMEMTYLDQNGQAQYPIMGCYGIGVGRLCASVCEESHDDWGPIWPISIAPWQVEICNLRASDTVVNETALSLYQTLQNAGVEVLYDDRDIRPGAMFADADLFGIPVRVVISPKTCEKGIAELSLRDKSYREEIPLADAAQQILALIQKLMQPFEA
ncbi:MAG: proline--tRNA ligase [Eubacteriales bacterium]|nr:proline--tRNA ligase [Eubacteriales bacterium]